MEKIVLGRITVISSVPPTSNKVSRSGAGAPQHAKAGVRAASIDEVQALTTFKIWQPKYLPSLAWELVDARATMAAPTDAQRVIGTFLKYREGQTHWFAIEQSPIFGEQKVGIPFSLSQGAVGSQIAAYFKHTVTAEQFGGGLTILHCLWEYGDYLMEIQSPWLSYQELIKIAESLV